MRLACALLLLALAPLRAQQNQGLETAQAWQRAVEGNPADLWARLNLARAYFQLYFDGPELPANQVYAQKAEAEFNRVMERFPKSDTARTSLALLGYWQAEQIQDAQQKSRKLDEIRRRYHREVRKRYV